MVRVLLGTMAQYKCIVVREASLGQAFNNPHPFVLHQPSKELALWSIFVAAKCSMYVDLVEKIAFAFHDNDHTSPTSD